MMSSFGHCQSTSIPMSIREELTGSDKPIGTLSGHTNRVGRVAFHPSGSFLGSASFDGTWRLWDVAKQKELMTQEGHSKEVYALTFQDDGALVASG